MANKISLNIAGFNLIINTQEDEAQVRKLNEMLNNDLKQILSQNPSASVTNAALLCALDYLDRYDKATNSASNMRDQIKDYMSDASNAKLQFDEEVRRNEELSAEVESLRARITKLASEGAAGTAVEQSLRTEIDSVRNELANVRNQLSEQMEKNSSILADFGTLNNALKNKDGIISGLNERINTLTAELDETKSMVIQARSEKNDVVRERDELSALIEELRSAPAAEPEPEPEAVTEPVAEEVPEVTPVIPDEPFRPEPASFSFPDSTVVGGDFPEEMTEDLEDDTFPVQEKVTESLPLYEDENEEPAEEPETKTAPRKDYRFFDYEDGAVEETDEVGVGDGFKTFGQMIAEERKQPGSSYEEANSAGSDEDLPNLSWINDID